MATSKKKSKAKPKKATPKKATPKKAMLRKLTDKEVKAAKGAARYRPRSSNPFTFAM